MAVLAVVARSGERGITRERLLSLLWPDSDEESGRRTLAQALYALRKDTGVNELFLGVQELKLNPEVSSCDAVELEAALRAGELERAVALYDGPFLDGFRLPGAAEFDRWIEEERDALTARYGEALEKLALRAREAGDCAGAIRWWRKRAALDPLSGRISLQLMEALVAAGEPSAALQHARVHEALMEQQLELPPDRAVIELAERIRSGEIRSSAQPAQGASSSPVVLRARAQGGTSSWPAGANPDGGVQASDPGAAAGITEDPDGAAGMGDGGAASRTLTASPNDAAPPVGSEPGSPPTIHAAPGTGDPRDTAPAAPERPHWSGRRRILAGAVLAIVIAATLGAAWRATGRIGGLMASGVLGTDEQILLADFVSPTGDSLLATVATEALRIDLSRSRTFSLLDPTDVRAALMRMQRPRDATLDEELARELAQREGVRAIIGGEVVRAGPSYVLTARIASAETGRTLASLRETARDSTAFLDALDRLSAALRSQVGDSFREVRRSPRLAEVTTPSLGALRAYTQALRAIGALGDLPQAIVLLEEAIALDPSFAAAYRALEVALARTGADPSRRAEVARLAYETRERATDRERHAIAAAYYRLIGDTDRAITEYQAGLRLPGLGAQARQSMLNNLGNLHGQRRDYARAEEHYRLAIAADSVLDFSPYMNLQRALVMQERFEEAQQTIHRMERIFPDAPTPWIARAALYGVQGDLAAAEAEARALLEARGGSPNWRIGGSRMLAHVLVLRGRLEEAERLLEDAAETADRSSNLAGLYGATLDLATLDALVRRRPERAIERVEGILSRQPLETLPLGARPYLSFALFYAMVEQPERVHRLLAEFETHEPPELRWGGRRLEALVRGVLAVAENRPGDGILLLQTADAGACTICALPFLGEAYERAGQPDAAIAAYEKYLEGSWPDRVAPWFQGSWEGRGDAFWKVRALERLAALHTARGNAALAERYRTEVRALAPTPAPLARAGS